MWDGLSCNCGSTKRCPLEGHYRSGNKHEAKHTVTKATVADSIEIAGKSAKAEVGVVKRAATFIKSILKSIK